MIEVLMEIKVLKNVMCKNDALGNDNRDRMCRHNIFAINMTSSPGAGKTTLLENTLDFLKGFFRSAVIEGDLYTSRDAERLQRFDIPLVQINTDGGCHLDARMISKSLDELNLEQLDLVIIENVGNLVCPSSFDLGENMRVLIYSITEGADKPMKYANMFKSAHVVLINKVDLAEACAIDLDALEQEVREVNPTCKIFKISATKKESLHRWNDWLISEIKKYRDGR